MRQWNTLATAKTWLVVLGMTALGLAPGCGAKDEPTPAATQPGAEGSGEPLPSVEGAEEAEYVAWLKANDLDRVAIATEGGTTRSGKQADASIWLLHPREEVRLEGLQTWRIQVDAETFEPDGHLEFRKGKEVLWRDEAPFKPSADMSKGGVPSTVLAALKPGDVVTWGVFYGDKRDATTTFRVVTKATGEKVEKQVARVQKDRKNAKQSPLVKRLGRDQVLLNNGLYAEGLADYLDIVEQSPAVFEAWLRIVESLRGLKLEDCHLYQDASQQLRNTPRARPVPTSSGIGDGGSEAGLGGEGTPRPARVVPAAARAQALLAAQLVASNRSKQAAADVARALKAAEDAAKKAAESKQAMDGAQPGEHGAAEIAKAYERARLEAEAAKKHAEDAGKRKLDQDRLVEFLQKMGAPTPSEVPDPQIARDVLREWLSGLKQAADAKQSEANALAAEAARAAAAGGGAKDVEAMTDRARLAQEEADALKKDAEQAGRAVTELAP